MMQLRVYRFGTGGTEVTPFPSQGWGKVIVVEAPSNEPSCRHYLQTLIHQRSDDIQRKKQETSLHKYPVPYRGIG